MTIPATARRSPVYVGNGVSTDYAFSFKVTDATTVVVTVADENDLNSEVLENGVDYTVTLNADQDADPGGEISYASLPVDHRLVITTETDSSQPTAITNLGAFHANVLEGALDRIVILHQQQQEQLDRCVKVAVTSEDDPSTLLDSALTTAANSASAASGSESNALTYRNEAEGFRDEAEGFRDEAEGFRDQASGSASAASGSASAASGSASAASGSASAASGSASAAAGSALAASGSESNALTYRNEAEGFRDEAEGFRDEAEGFRDQASGSASAASGSASTASGHAATAAAAAAVANALLALQAGDTGGTLTVDDRGGARLLSSGVTVPASVFAARDVVVLYNNTAGDLTITEGASLTLRFAGSAATGNRTLAQRGLATVVFISPTEAVISGAGVS